MGKAKLTRKDILEKSFEMIYRNGYKSTSIDKIIASTAVTKGAFFHHFKNKEEMGIALINEIIAPKILDSLVKPIRNSEDPIQDVVKSLKKDLLENTEFKPEYGCPINNLVMEMSPVNQTFRENLQNLLNIWKKTLVDEFESGKSNGKIKENMNSEQVAEFVIVSYEGLRGTGKVYRGKDLYFSYLNQIESYLESFRAE